MTFREALAEQRWDDHRYYHHSPVNQSLHLVSAIAFLCSYAMVFVEPAAAVFVAWLVAMPSRQIGHFWFEPKNYDIVNQATHEHKEAIKVGYNLRRKVVLLSIWLVSPLVLLVDPSFFGAVQAHTDWRGLTRNISVVWLVVAAGGLAFRTIQLCVIRDVQTGLVWCTKILTDPFHDVKLYHRAPLKLMRPLPRADAGGRACPR